MNLFHVLLKRIYRTLPIVISFRDRWYYNNTLEIGLLMTSSSSAGPIQISEFLEPWAKYLFPGHIHNYPAIMDACVLISQLSNERIRPPWASC